MEKITSENAILPTHQSQLVPLLSTLSDKGYILLLHNTTDMSKSWVILKPEVLLTKVNGSIFDPKNFKEHCGHEFALNTGVVALSKLKEKFKNFNHKVITGYLIHMEYCFQITDQQVLEIITKDPSLKVRNRILLFSRLSSDRQSNRCMSTNRHNHISVWLAL